jgi:hypothetical protein
MALPVINTREDLDALNEKNPAQYLEFMAYLKGSMSRQQNVAEYPEGYGQPGYEGPTIDPVWETVEDLSTIERYGFTKADFA